MSLQSAQAFLQRLHDDQDFFHKVSNAADHDARKVISKEAGFDFTESEMREAVAAQNTELTEEELEAVAGGSVSSTVSGVVTAATMALCI